MSTLSQFFNSAASSGAGGVSYFGTSGSLTVPSDVTYIAYGAMGAGARGSCVNRCGATGGGFSWWEGAVNCASPFNLTVTVGSAGANGGTSIVSGGPTTICATGGLSTGVGGIGYCGLINTCGGIGSCYYVVSCTYPRWYYCCYIYAGGGAGGLMGNGGNAQTLAGGGFGSGGGGGWNSGFGGAGLGSPSGPGLNGEVGTPGYSVSYNLNGKLSQAKTFLSASGGGAGLKNTNVYYAAGAGGGGSNGYAAGFGGGSGGLGSTQILAGCGGGGHDWIFAACTVPDGYGGGGGYCISPQTNVCGGNGFVAVEYWK